MPLIAMGVSSWLDLRVSRTFLVARELSRYTVLQGRHRSRSASKPFACSCIAGLF